PTTGNTGTGQGRCAFQNNIIPASRMYQGATNFWQLMAPYTPNNTLGQPFTQFTSENDIRLRNSAWNRNIYTGKVDYNISDGQTVLGLVNSNTPANDPRYSGMPGLSIGDFTGLGTNQGWEPFRRNDWQLTLDENATWIKGKHTIVFGLDAAHNHLNHWQPEIV